MARKKFNPLDHIAELNGLKAQMERDNISLSESEFKKALKLSGIPQNHMFLSELRIFNIITCSSGKISFSIKGPIHFSKLQEVYTSYKKRVDRYNSKKGVENEFMKEQIRLCISFLNKMGYTVSKN